MITEAQKVYINKYLKMVGITQQELHDEFFDHIATSFEVAVKRQSELEIETYIREEIQPAFGGVEGIKKIAKRKLKEVNNIYRKQLFANFRAYFRWPMILVAISIFLILLKSFQLFKLSDVLLTSLVVFSFPAVFLALGGCISFYISCKRKKLPYYSSVKNSVIMTQLLMLCWSLQIPNFLNVFYDQDLTTLHSPGLAFILSVILTFTIILSLAYLKLMRENFDFKLKLA